MMGLGDADGLGVLVNLLLGAGGGAGLVGLIAGLRGWRKDSWAKEGTLLQRLNEDSQQQGERADSESMRARGWEDQAARYRRQLIAHGIDPDDTVWTYGIGNHERRG